MCDITWEVQKAGDGLSGGLELRRAGESAVQGTDSTCRVIGADNGVATSDSWCGVSRSPVRKGFIEGHSDLSRQKLQVQLDFLGLRKE